MAGENASRSSKGSLALSILVMTIGTGWLLTALGIGPGIDWPWTLGLGVVGILTFVVSGGVDKVSVVVGPFLVVGSCLSILRQRGCLRPDTEVPVLVILAGALLLIARMPRVPLPRWALEPQPGGKDYPG